MVEKVRTEYQSPSFFYSVDLALGLGNIEPEDENGRAFADAIGLVVVSGNSAYHKVEVICDSAPLSLCSQVLVASGGLSSTLVQCS